MSHPLYTFVFRHAFTRLDPEVAHHRAARAIELAGRVAPVRAALAATFGRTGRTGRSTGTSPAGPTLFGRHLSSPLGAAAGFDKEARMVPGLLALGFSHVEIGTVTAHAQPGNDRPRLWRLVDERALVNRMGFNNSGSAAVAARLAALRRTRAGRSAVVGVNIGKTKVTPPEHAAQDYALSASALARFADYLVVNVSSPNTPGLRDLQAVASLRPILQAVQAAADASARRHVPVLVKIAPDLSQDDVVDVCALVTELDLAGVVATNTTIDHDHGPGGLSGEPLHARALEVVRLVRAHLPGRVVIGVGGVSDAAGVRRMLEAGADVVQAYTAFIYSGPAWPGAVARELAGSR
ncbi:MAG TPA: dihydroorotate dehydrogenase (quinone) [Micrococcales bacterium]|uniref:quinone-dependent dihydroorotate dehydrogenase n=1 Tax=Miniimonas TaxID=947525 RepID=UPI000D525B14|nr:MULTISPECIES: quinone-dependent dihydroorotate dehydrogenase [Miniimonas]HCX85820.1 dihydroorotate dehydrogenase (quinone) [Micrococcales bacterium]